MAKLFVSDAIVQERLALTPQESGADSWGWKKLSLLYKASFAACGYDITAVIRPEIYQADAALKIMEVKPGDLHLAVKPIEHLRPFHGVINAFVCDWPFLELATGPRGDSPFYNQARCLSVADVILCCTEFTTQTLRHAGIEQAITLPPIIASHGRDVSSRAQRGAFLSVVEQPHLARQLGGLIEGFALATQQEPSLRLIICLQGCDARNLSELRQRVAQSGAGLGLKLEESISVIGGGEDETAMLYDSAAFFICADAAPGLSLPLIEAMLAGLPVVTTMTGGTGSFLRPEAAIPIATEPRIVAAEDEPIARFLDLTANAPTANAVRDAVLAAAALDDDARSRLARTGREISETQFGQAAFQSGLKQMNAVIALDAP
jgi:glycosyltransferase involved in cell wall biosynthesis